MVFVSSIALEVTGVRNNQALTNILTAILFEWNFIKIFVFFSVSSGKSLLFPGYSPCGTRIYNSYITKLLFWIWLTEWTKHTEWQNTFRHIRCKGHGEHESLKTEGMLGVLKVLWALQDHGTQTWGAVKSWHVGNWREHVGWTGLLCRAMAHVQGGPWRPGIWDLGGIMWAGLIFRAMAHVPGRQWRSGMWGIEGSLWVDWSALQGYGTWAGRAVMNWHVGYWGNNVG